MTKIFELHHTDSSSKARLGRVKTDHGVIETPIFMPVGTQATVKGVSRDDLKERINAPIILGNTYHLYLRPGMELMREVGGLHAFMGWDRAILTDSGGYQIFSLSDMRSLEEKGAKFKSHLDGSEHWFTPENVVDIQRDLGSDIMMILDECPPWPASYRYVRESMELTHRWAQRGRDAFEASTARYGHSQLQFGIVQGGTYSDLRKASAEFMASLPFEGLAIGGLSVGEPTEVMMQITDENTDVLPEDRPRYLMGVGTPANLLEAIRRGIDMFDCVMPTRNARNGMLFTQHGIVNLRNAHWRNHHKPLDPDFPSELCQAYNMSYLHHLFRCNELLGMELASEHNLTFYLWLMDKARQAISEDRYESWVGPVIDAVTTRL